MRVLLLFLSFCTLLCLSGSAEEVCVVKKPSVYQAVCGERPLFDYRYAEMAYKPYVSKLYTPLGVNILRDSPSDHLHHHAMMMAFLIDGGDFWDERSKKKPGKQVTTAIEMDDQSGGIVSTIDWIKNDGKKVVVEKRTVKAVTLPKVKATLLDWRSTLRCVEGREKVDISGLHYFGLGLRFVESMDRGGRFFFGGQQGKPVTVRNDERVTRACWAAYTAKVSGKPVTVAVFDAPKNPIPMRAFTMGDGGSKFAYLSATLGLYKRSPLELKACKPLTLHWGVALWDGEVTSAEVEAAFQAWVK